MNDLNSIPKCIQFRCCCFLWWVFFSSLHSNMYIRMLDGKVKDTWTIQNNNLRWLMQYSINFGLMRRSKKLSNFLHNIHFSWRLRWFLFLSLSRCREMGLSSFSSYKCAIRIQICIPLLQRYVNSFFFVCVKYLFFSFILMPFVQSEWTQGLRCIILTHL